MSCNLNAMQADLLLTTLAKDYKIYAPKRFIAQGRFSDTDIISYGEVEKFNDIVQDTKSDYPAKEVITPIQQAIFYFTEDEYRESKAPTKPILIFARPCDINAQEIQAQIYAGNGGFTDVYYERKRLKKHPMWDEFNSRCISCGACTIACSTCTYFTTRDVTYGDNPGVGECRRVSASCKIAGFDQMAGQREFRSTAADRMRYKVMHKFHDHKARFGDRHMCIGCGRCTRRCPEIIAIHATVNKMNVAVAEIKAAMENE